MLGTRHVPFQQTLAMAKLCHYGTPKSSYRKVHSVVHNKPKFGGCRFMVSKIVNSTYWYGQYWARYHFICSWRTRTANVRKVHTAKDGRLQPLDATYEEGSPYFFLLKVNCTWFYPSSGIFQCRTAYGLEMAGQLTNLILVLTGSKGI